MKLQYSEAFQALSYKLNAPRTDWTATGDHGVCVSLWEKVIGWRKGQPFYDSRESAGPLAEWVGKQGNKRRIKHLSLALDKFDGFVDVVIARGDPNVGVDSAHPWIPEERKGFRWHITYLDPETGHCAIETQPPANRPFHVEQA